MRVVYSVDERYAMPLAVSLRSLIDNAADPAALRVSVLTTDLTEESVEQVAKSCPEVDLDVVRVSAKLVAGLPTSEYWTRTIYLRLLLPSLVDGDERVLSLDADTVVLTDLTELYRTDLDGHPIGAVRDPVRGTFGDRGPLPHWTELGIPDTTPYLSAGLLVIDRVAWQAEQVTERAMEYLRRYGDAARFLEEEALNVVLRDHWRPLDQAWSVWTMMIGALRLAEKLGIDYVPSVPRQVLENPRILHFAGKDKPWMKDAMKGPASSTFYHYVDRTTWAGWRPE